MDMFFVYVDEESSGIGLVFFGLFLRSFRWFWRRLFGHKWLRNPWLQSHNQQWRRMNEWEKRVVVRNWGSREVFICVGRECQVFWILCFQEWEDVSGWL